MKTVLAAGAACALLSFTPAHASDADPLNTEQPVVSTIGDRVWLDANKDGLQSADEPGFAGVTLQLLSASDDQSLGETVSDADGKYTFTGEFPEKVYLKATLPEGYAFAARQAGDDRTVDNDIDPATGKSPEIDLGPTEIEGQPAANATGWDIGVVAVSAEPQQEGVVGPGFWKNHLEIWPLEQIEINGGKTYTKEEAAKLLTNGADKSYALFRSLVTALLNRAAGAPADCIEEALAQAQTWVAAHEPGSNVRPNDPAWQETGRLLNQTLENYNDGLMCAPERHESTTPPSIKTGHVEREKGKAKQLQVRVTAEKGRTLILQKSADLTTWVDVEVMSNLYGVSDALRAEIENDPSSFYRVVFPSGPAQKPKAAAAPAQPFRQVGENETVELLPVVYEGSLRITGSNNTVTGSTLDGTSNTVIAGDLFIAGDQNKVSQLRVLGKVVLLGSGNELDAVDYEGGIQEPGGKKNDY